MTSKLARSLLILVSVAGALPLFSCSSKEGKEGQEASRAKNLTLPPAQREKIKVETVASSTFRRALETTGTVAFDADQATSVLSPISGPVSRLLISVGSSVKAGEPLAIVASPDFATAVGAYRKADAAARNTRRIADLDQKLFENDAISKREAQQAETDAISAESDRDASLLALRALGVDEKGLDEIRQGHPTHEAGGVIRSPINGTLVEKLITPGQLLQAGTTPCFTVADLSTVWVMANIFESDLPFVSVGDPAEIRTNVTADAFPGRVDYVAALVDPTTRAIAVRIVVRNPQRLLKRDLYVRVTLNSRQESTGLLVPVSAVLRDDENLPFLYIVNEDASFARRPVTLGPQVGDQYEIKAGIRAGDRIVVEGGLFMQFAQNQ